MIGKTVSHYRIVEELGEGGMGQLYVAQDETLGRRVALKAIREERRLSATARGRFLREARVLSRLDHPHICRIHDYLESDGADFLILELIEGRTLRTAMREGLGRGQTLRIAEQLASALLAAHAAGIVHRDLKPENVMLTHRGELKVLDFGLARTGNRHTDSEAGVEVGGEPTKPVVPTAPGRASHSEEETTAPDSEAGTLASPADLVEAPVDPGGPLTELGTVAGTLRYMSPEQARGEPATPASDMYSMGLLLQELLTGGDAYPPVRDRREMLALVAKAETLPATGVSGDLARLLERMKALAPARRPTAVETAERLTAIREAPRRRAQRLVAAALLLTAVGAGVKYTVDLERERSRAAQRRDQAEALISFMLGDLRSKLEPIGRTAILDEVGDKALEYFATVEPAELTDEELHGRSVALNQIGEIRIDQGDLDAAAASFVASHRLARDLVDRNPGEGRWLKELGACHFWLGNVRFLRGDLDEALEEFEVYRGVSERLSGLDPDNREWQLEVAYAHTNLGAVYDTMGKTELALRHVRSSNAIKQRLLAAAPGDPALRASLANGIAWLAGALHTSGQLDASLARYREELELREALWRDDHHDMERVLFLAIARRHTALLLLLSGKAERASAAFEGAVEAATSLVAADPLNFGWRRELAIAHAGLGDALLEEGAIAEARERFSRSVALLEPLVRSQDSTLAWRLDLAFARYGVASCRLAEGRAGEALAAAEEAIAVASPTEALDNRDREVQRVLAPAWIAKGIALRARGDATGARAAWTRALKLVRPWEQTRDADLLDPMARALLLLSRKDEAAPILGRLADIGYDRRALRDLASASGVGR